MKVYLSRWVCLDVDVNLRRLPEESASAAATGAGLVMFPELFLTGYTRALEPSRANWVFREVSRAAPSVLFLFGSISSEGRNRLTVWLGGEEAAHYEKIHLFRPNREHEIWQPGDRHVAVRHAGLTLGLITCNDVRFPEQARALRLEAGCNLLLVPAWWPWRRDDVWRALLKARAIENGVWVLGCCISGSVFPGEEFAGAGNHVFDPLGNPVPTPDDVCYELDIDHPPPLVVDTAEQAVAISRVDVVEAKGA